MALFSGLITQLWTVIDCFLLSSTRLKQFFVYSVIFYQIEYNSFSFLPFSILYSLAPGSIFFASFTQICFIYTSILAKSKLTFSVIAVYGASFNLSMLKLATSAYMESLENLSSKFYPLSKVILFVVKFSLCCKIFRASRIFTLSGTVMEVPILLNLNSIIKYNIKIFRNTMIIIFHIAQLIINNKGLTCEIYFYQIYYHRSSQLMYKHILMAILFLLGIVGASCAQIIESQMLTIAQSNNKNMDTNNQLQSEGDSIFSNPIVIALIVLISFNILVFILVYGCRRCLRLPFQVNESEARNHFGQKYPNIKFKSHSHCLTQGEYFYGRDCYDRNQVIATVPAFIYGREIDAEISHLDYFIIRQCSSCGGLTRTLEIFKYGKLRQCWETLFMIVISPCFLAFTIHRITANTVLWRKFFCTQCGFQKEVHK